jgi:hypothetical protein
MRVPNHEHKIEISKFSEPSDEIFEGLEKVKPR